jgi:mRNA interferase MazF
MRQGDIIITNFPFTSLKGSKIRPALIISNGEFNRGVDVILLGIFGTKSIYSQEIKQKELALGHLNKTSYIRFSNLFTLEKDLILKKIGALSQEGITKISKQLVNYLN